MSEFDDIHETISKIKEKLSKEAKFARGTMWNGQGVQIWEEPIEEYRTRMLELGGEYLEYLNEKRQDIFDSMTKEVNELSDVINEFEIKLKEKQ